MTAESNPTTPAGVRAFRPHLEGAEGKFSQTWFPVCLSSEVGRGEVKGFDFLDGRVIVMRGDDDKAQVLSAYCPHLGADLAIGDVIGSNIRCAFHHWQYDCSGKCIRTGPGDRPPPSATLFRFPTVEKYGLIYAFNGEKALFDLPEFKFPENEIIWRTVRFDEIFTLDPWVVCCNTPDIQHIRVVHGIEFDSDDPGANAEWTDHSMLFEFTGRHAGGEPIDFEVGIFGTSIFYQSSHLNGRWFGFMAPMGLLRPQRTQVYMTLAVRNDEPEAEDYLQSVIELEKRVVSEDLDILRSIRFRPGAMTVSDKTLVRFLRYLTKYPRAHPSADYIK